MYKRLQSLCKEKNTSVTALCRQVTGSEGNLSTWKKGYMRSDYAAMCADILGVSVDYLLGREDKKISPVLTTEDKLQDFVDKLTQLSQAELQELDNYLAFLEYKRSL